MVMNALEYYDKNSERNDKYLKNVKFLRFIDVSDQNKGDIEKAQIIMFNDEKIEIFRSRYELIGQFNRTTNTWIWAWALPKVTKNKNYISRKILNYGLDIDADNPNSTFLKAELITGRFRITDDVQLDLHVAIASYISKMPNVYMFIKDKTKISIPLVEQGDMDTSNDYIIFYLFLLDDPSSIKSHKN